MLINRYLLQLSTKTRMDRETQSLIRKSTIILNTNGQTHAPIGFIANLPRDKHPLIKKI